MYALDNRTKRIAWLLILVYLPMMLAVTFHHHDTVEEDATEYCQDCAHHIHHNGHITAQHGILHDCLLCQFRSLPYVVPTIIHVAVFVTAVSAAYAMPCPFVRTRHSGPLSTRAPPAFISF